MKKYNTNNPKDVEEMIDKHIFRGVLEGIKLAKKNIKKIRGMK